jgi:hypothetical protein
MRTVRFPIAGLMGAVLVVALGSAALRNASTTWAGATFLLTCGVLCLAVVGIVCRGDAKRAWWLGFALFGWGYLVLAFWSLVDLPTMALLDTIGARLGVTVQFRGSTGGMGGGMWSPGPMGGGFGGPPDGSIQQISQCLWALVAALVGGGVANALFGGPRERTEKLDAHTQFAAQTPRRRWLWPAVLGLAACVLIVCLGLFGSRSAPGFWAGATFLSTCGLLAMTVLGVASSQGKRRQIWLGAALFGVGYMTLAFGRSLDRETWPSLPTDHLLYALRPWLPPVVSSFPTSSVGIASADARIWEALEQPVPMRYPNEAPLEDILKSIQAATRGPNGKGIPIYVDPIGLQEAERTMTSTVVIDLEGVALKTTLRLCLKQLGLSYAIRDGLLMITSEESEVTPVYQDTFLIVGHCLLALLAAGLGGIVAPLVFDMRREPIARVANGQSPRPISGQAGTGK